MASLHKIWNGKSRNYYGAYTIIDAEGRPVRRFRSTGTSNKKEAEQVLAAWVRAANQRSGLTPDRARQVIAQGVADVLVVSSNETMEFLTLRQWCERWLNTKSLEARESTHERYTQAINRFLESMGKRADKMVDTVRVADVMDFRNTLGRSLSFGTANTDLRIVRACLHDGVRHELIAKNVASSVKILETEESTRRAFTEAEVRKILAQCDKAGGEWRGLVLAGLYTGQRFGDVAAMKWRQVDLHEGKIHFNRQKNRRNKKITIGIAKPLLAHLMSLPASDDPEAYVFPEAGQVDRVSTLSNRFYEKILTGAGLVKARSHKKPKGEVEDAGRKKKRELNELSFHSFRHSLTTWLKDAGASEAIAREIVGHESEVVSRGYTHLDDGHSKKWIAKLPDVTSKEAQ